MVPSAWKFILPFMLGLVLIEWIAACRENRRVYFRDETIQSLLIGILYIFTNLGMRVLIFVFNSWIYEFRILTFGDSPWVWVAGILAADFSYYWFHRVSHEVNFFWCSHAVHHSPEHFNIIAGFRVSLTTQPTGQFLFWAWMPLLGFHPVMMVILVQIVITYQSWLHTELIGKLHPSIEFIFNTPSHHRVHHASNIEYLDKNHGGMLIIWDRIFGTYVEETESPVYGLTEKQESQSAAGIMAAPWKKLFHNLGLSQSVKESFRYLFGQPGWSPMENNMTTRSLRRKALVKQVMQNLFKP